MLGCVRTRPCWLLCCAVALLVWVTGALGAPVARQPVVTPADKAVMDLSARQARPLDLSAVARLVRPPRVDYSDDITYIRCQNSGPGCPTFATLYIADVLNEFQHPFTPDLSWRFAERTWDEAVNNLILTQHIQEVPDMLDATFSPGVASEGLCPSWSDYLTIVPPNNPALVPLKGAKMYWDPAPEAAAKEEAQIYKFHVSAGITPDVDTLKTLLLTHGPVWGSGGWWWNGAHVMAFVGYDDATQQFKLVDSAGDWMDEQGFHHIPYDKLTDYVQSLRVVELMPTARATSRWQYSSRFRIHGTWRGTWSVNIGVQGQVPLTVYRSYGRMADRPYCYGERLDLDVPLPDYAAKFWPPGGPARWYLQVEDNDRDGQQGQVVEWILARNYEDANCQSVGHWKTETYKYSHAVIVPDATGDPIATPLPSPANPAPPKRNSNPGLAMLYLPETESSGGPLVRARLAPRFGIALDLGGSSIATTGSATIKGTLSSYLLASSPLAGKSVEVCQLVADRCVNKPPSWQKIASAPTNAQGVFECQFQVPALGRTVIGVAYRATDGTVLCSTKPLVHQASLAKWQEAQPQIVLSPGLFPPLLQVPGLRQPVLRVR